ncbi:MAG: GrpB family protein, partial [Halobacteriales archaeon]
ALPGHLDDVVRIEHVGSTTVPDLAAKDVVDLDVVVASGAVPTVARALADRLGGIRAENGPTWHPVFRRSEGQRFNDHVFDRDAPGWKVSVVTRDVLRLDPARRRAYESRKRELAAATDDLERYSRGKTSLIAETLATARDEARLAHPFEIPHLEG